MTVNDLITNVNTFIGDSSNDRVSQTDRLQAITEATAWLLEELGNEHMVDRADIEYLPTLTWYKMENLTPYLLTAGQLRFADDEEQVQDFTRVEARDLVNMTADRNAYAIERFNDETYVGINIPESTHYPQKDLIAFSANDGLTYTGINADGIFEEKDAVRFDMLATGVTSTGLSTVTGDISLEEYQEDGVIIVEVEIPDITDVTSVTIKFGDNLGSAYYAGTVTTDVHGNALAVGVNTLKFKWEDLILVGAPVITSVNVWSIVVNHLSTKPAVDGFKISDLRITKPIALTFKYIFYRVGKSTGGTDIIEFTATSDVPFFSERYPQYKFAVAHKAAGVLYRSLQLFENSREEDAQARQALTRYRKNFSGERDSGSSAFKPAGISFRNRRFIRRR